MVPSLHLALGDEEEALRLLDRGVEEHAPWMPWIGIDFLFAPLHDDPRLQALLRRMNIPNTPPA